MVLEHSDAALKRWAIAEVASSHLIYKITSSGDASVAGENAEQKEG